MNHAEASELLGAYALDAVDAEEAAAVEAHLETCPRCRDELRSHREVVGLLAHTGHDAPEGMWDRVVARINDPADSSVDFGPPPSLRSLPAGTPAGRQSRPRPRITRIGALAAAAAVVVVALLGVEVARLQNRTNHLQGQIAAMTGAPTMATVRSALAVPGAQHVTLTPVSGGGDELDAVVLPGGQGYLYDSRLAPLLPARTYQLWGVVGDQRISYGVLGSDPPAVMPFRASKGVQALAVTAEVAGGVVTSTQKPVAVGLFS